jgi:hypothetical protein
MDSPASKRPPRKWVIVVAVVITVGLAALGVFEVLSATAGCPGCASNGPIKVSLALGFPAVSVSGTTWVYNFTVEAVPTDIQLTDLGFQAKSPDGEPIPIGNICILGTLAAAVGTWNGTWAATGDSETCSLRASLPPGTASLTTDDSVIVYMAQNATGNVLYVSAPAVFTGWVSTPF